MKTKCTNRKGLEELPSSYILKMEPPSDPIKPKNNKKIGALLSNGLGWTFQKKLCESWKDGALWCMTKYKPVAKKVRPVNQPIPQALNPPLKRPPLLRDPYKTPLTPHPPEFTPTERFTEEHLKVLNFGPKDFLWEEELKLFKHLIVTREQVLAFSPEERGLLKHSYGLPYIIPVVDHIPWQKKLLESGSGPKQHTRNSQEETYAKPIEERQTRFKKRTYHSSTALQRHKRIQQLEKIATTLLQISNLKTITIKTSLIREQNYSNTRKHTRIRLKYLR
ncbi:hypothetical protein PSTG_03726 [Puccinia striiformis f. sp. tritici PST-78]|uniref:Uncharacterized protein n=1 Tax=Puccinia striiformis f. sp. tritici PST-78 TaxID=1165861 RepID=A0A0L0VV51_9BASI|nr:hypothetical protein PSTG_03726 [Puccinia striiformis f. sp. tritici PST-78]